MKRKNREIVDLGYLDFDGVPYDLVPHDPNIGFIPIVPNPEEFELQTGVKLPERIWPLPAPPPKKVKNAKANQPPPPVDPPAPSVE